MEWAASKPIVPNMKRLRVGPGIFLSPLFFPDKKFGLSTVTV